MMVLGCCPNLLYVCADSSFNSPAVGVLSCVCEVGRVGGLFHRPVMHECVIIG